MLTPVRLLGPKGGARVDPLHARALCLAPLTWWWGCGGQNRVGSELNGAPPWCHHGRRQSVPHAANPATNWGWGLVGCVILSGLAPGGLCLG